MDIPRTGAVLQADIDFLQVNKRPIVDEFIYEKDTIMIYGPPAVGKTTILLQLAMHISSATKAYGALDINKKWKVYYLQLEGEYDETIEQIRLMKEVIPYDPQYLCIDEYKRIDVLNKNSVIEFIKRVKDSFEPEIFIIDPIYKLASRDISTGDSALAIVDFSDILIDNFHCVNLFAHHPHRPPKVDGKIVDEENPYYGHSFIENHIRTSYQIKSDNTRQNPTLYRKKGRGDDTLPFIKLHYNPVTHTCFMDDRTSALERVISYIFFLKKNNKTADFYEIAEHVDLSHSHLRRIKMREEITSMVIFDKSSSKKELWIPK